MSDKKIKILVIADHPLSPSGVGTQTKYMIESCLKTDKFSFICLGGAIKHMDYKPVKVEPWGEDFIVIPVDGYGNHDMIRSLLRTHKPDILWFMTDPRFFKWLWEIENEIRAVVPMVYYHVWDNYPYPQYNKVFYDSNDYVLTISKVTDDIVKTVSPEVKSVYLPHAVNNEIFKPLEKEEYEDFISKTLPQIEDKFVFFWNNRNARRKQSGSLIFWFKEFLDKVGHDKACLMMHTNPKDEHGQDLNAIIEELGLINGEIIFSTQAVDAPLLGAIYNTVDCTINISDAEGFGLATLESLSCGTPIIVNMTGGLQEQVTDGENWFGIGLEPSSKAIIGSQEVPYIYEDRLDKDDFINAMLKIYNMTSEEREKLGELGRQHVEKNYSFSKLSSTWPVLLEEIHNEMGSWETRKGYKSWELIEVTQ
jgi:glycosyltransferase involved in cell wall biosynthesis